MKTLTLFFVLTFTAFGQWVTNGFAPVPFPSWPLMSQPPSGQSQTLSASTHKAAICGYLKASGTADKTVSTVSVRLGALTKAGGTDLRIGFQTKHASGVYPSGTWIASNAGYVDVADANLTGDSWLTTGAFTDTTMTPNAFYCLTAEPVSFGGSDSIVFSGIGIADWRNQRGVRFDGSSWATAAASYSHVIAFSDSTFGTIGSVVPHNGTTWANKTIGNTTTLNETTRVGDEVGLETTFAVNMKVHGICINPSGAIYDLYDLVLYNGTTEVRAVDGAELSNESNYHNICGYFEPYSLTAGTPVIAVVKPNSATTLTVREAIFNDAGYRSVLEGGASSRMAFRADAGAWSYSTVALPIMMLLVTPDSAAAAATATSYPIQ